MKRARIDNLNVHLACSAIAKVRCELGVGRLR